MSAPRAELGFTLPPLTINRPFSPETPIPKLRILFNGQGAGAAELFQKLIDDGHEIVSVVATKKKDKAGKNDLLRQTALDNNIEIIDLADVNEASTQGKMRLMNADLGVCMYLQKVLDKKTFSIPKFGTLNLHYSLLPNERGRDAMNRTIMKGDAVLGMTAFLMVNKVDAGPVAGYFAYENPGDTSQGSLYFQHQKDAILLMQKVVNNFAVAIDARGTSNKKQRLPLIVQDESQATQSPPLAKEEMKIDFKIMTAEEIKRMMLAGGPGAWIPKPGEVKINVSKPTVHFGDTTMQPGEVISIDEKGLLVSTKKEAINIGFMQEQIGDKVGERLLPKDFKFSYEDQPIAPLGV